MKINLKFESLFGGCLLVILVLLVKGAISWLLVCGAWKVITILFSLTFTWAIATGIWFVLFCLLLLINGLIKSNN